jgi:hypothetical protein
VEDQRQAPWELEEEDDEAWGLLLQLRHGGGVVEHTGDLQQGVGAILFSSFLSLLLTSSVLPSMFLFFCFCRMGRDERVERRLVYV